MNRGNLVKKVITDKNGKKMTVWVNTDTAKEKKRAKSHALTSKYESSLKKINKDLKVDNPDYKQALALKLIMLHGIRVGNEKSAEGFKRHGSKKVESTYGLLTIQPRHIVLTGTGAKIIFKGKKGITQNVTIKNRSLVDGLEHFVEQSDGGAVLGMTNYELRKYINRKIGKGFSPKDFRMMKANVEAKRKADEILKRKTTPKNKTELNEEVNEIANHVAGELGNTSKVAKRSYIDDNVLMEFMSNRMKRVK